ncbi:MAG TPA: hypothetical protein VMR54_12500 [Thermoanaerobaculia bacterium]|nr:hypothetical protein [Thermoanaerobaculia bacterium]
MKTEKEIRGEARRIRDRVKELSGFWIGEASAAIYALEWAIDKREAPPSEDIGKARGGREKIAAALVKLAEKTTPPRVKPRGAAGKKEKKRPGRRV